MAGKIRKAIRSRGLTSEWREFEAVDWDAEYSGLVEELPGLFDVQQVAGVDLWATGLSAPQATVYDSDKRFLVMVAGRRFGKTHLAIRELLKCVWKKPEAEAWYIAPTYRQAKRITWRSLKRLVKPYRPHINESELSVELRDGGRIALQGAEKYDSLRGPGLNGLVIDEAADVAHEAWTEVLRPMLSDRKGWSLFIGTPKGRNWFYDLYQDARVNKNWAAFQYTTVQGGNVDVEEVEAARHELDERTFRQEYEASFESLFDGAAYYAFSVDENVKPVEFDPRAPLSWSLDFNVDPMSSVICQVIGEEIRVLEELVIPNSNTLETCTVFLERIQKYREAIRDGRVGSFQIGLNVYGDATDQRHTNADKTDWKIIKEFFSRNSDTTKVEYRTSKSNPSVKGRIAAVNARLKNHAGERNLLVHPSCRELRADLERVSWKKDSHGNTVMDLDKRDPKRTHISDALGYLVEKEFGLRMVGGPRSTFIGV